MKIKLNTLAPAIMLLSLSALAIAAVDGLSVKRQFKEGQVVKLKLTADAEFQGSQITFTLLNDQKVTKVDSSGSYTLEVLQHDGKANVGGQEIDIPESPAVVAVYNADGSVKEIKGDDKAILAGAYRMTNLGVIIDPGKSLNVGDTWSVDIKADPKTGAEAAKADYKILGEEKVGDFDTIKIKATIKETSGSQPASSDGTYWLSKVDGSEVKAEFKWVDAPVPGSPMPITATCKLSRL